MKARVALSPMILFSLALSVGAVDVGNYKIPVSVNYGGVAVVAGNYMIQIEDGPGGPQLLLAKAGEVIAKDRAIVIPAKGTGKTSVQIAQAKEFVRLRVRHGENWYFAYLPKS